MRFNDEVQFTLVCVRPPADLPEIIAAAPHRSISTDCMTQGDTVCLPAGMQKEIANRAHEEFVRRALPRTKAQQLIDDILNDVFDKTVRKPDHYDDEWSKYTKYVEAAFNNCAATGTGFSPPSVTVVTQNASPCRIICDDIAYDPEPDINAQRRWFNQLYSMRGT